MKLFEETALADDDLPVAELKEHLRLGSGFDTLGMQDGLLRSYLRAAMAAIEGRTNKVLMARRFRLRLEDWGARHQEEGQALPASPVSVLVSVELVAFDGTLTQISDGRFGLVADLARPRLVVPSGGWPTIPQGGAVEITFDAGFGAQWEAVPADLRQAVLLLSAQYYEQRLDGAEAPSGFPPTVQSLIERWRVVRVLGGGRS